MLFKCLSLRQVLLLFFSHEVISESFDFHDKKIWYLAIMTTFEPEYILTYIYIYNSYIYVIVHF
jgi:hypothetical protein